MPDIGAFLTGLKRGKFG